MKKFFKIVLGIVGFIIFVIVIGVREEIKSKDEVGKNSDLKKVEKHNNENEVKIEVSFEIVDQNSYQVICYTNDPESLWNNPDWVRLIKRKMIRVENRLSQSSFSRQVLLFYKKSNTPTINQFNTSTGWEKNLVCSYYDFDDEKSLSGIKESFYWGGKNEDGDMKYSEEIR